MINFYTTFYTPTCTYGEQDERRGIISIPTGHVDRNYLFSTSRIIMSQNNHDC